MNTKENNLWGQEIPKVMVCQNGFIVTIIEVRRCNYNYNVYMQHKEGLLLLFVLCVDDFLITDGSTVGLRDIKSTLIKSFSMKNVGLLRQFIILEVNKKGLGNMIT